MADTVKLAAVGDISFSRTGKTLIDRKGAAYPFAEVAEDLAGADIRFGNQESVMIPDDFPAGKLNPRALQSEDAVTESLALAEFDVLNIATNHSLDCGWRGLLHTRACVEKAGAVPIGGGETPGAAGRMAVMEKKGLKIGFLGYVEAFNWTLHGGGGRINYFSPDKAVAEIEANRDRVDVIVVSLHAGLEFCDVPSRVRMEYCRRMAEAGADIILCHHAHVPQGVEEHFGTFIAYGLGNFHFPMGSYVLNGSPNTVHNHILMLDIGKEGVSGFERKLFKTAVPEEGRPCRMSDEEYAAAEKHYAHLDALLHNEEEYRKLWYARCREYLVEQWGWITEGGAEKFVETYGWRLLGLEENDHWTRGLAEMAREVYGDRMGADFEFDRPNSVFEKDGKLFT